MPGAPYDTMSQVKKGIKSLFRKKQDESSGSHAPTGGAAPASSHQAVAATSYESQPKLAPNAIALRLKEQSDAHTADQDQDQDRESPPPPPPPKDDPISPPTDTDEHSPSADAVAPPDVVVTPAPVQTEDNDDNEASTEEPGEEQSRSVPRVLTGIKASEDHPASPSSQASTLTEMHASQNVDRDDSPAPAMSATSGPLTDLPSFQ